MSARLLELSQTISKRKDNKQVLDKLKVERERGITVKAQVCSCWIYHTQRPWFNDVSTRYKPFVPKYQRTLLCELECVYVLRLQRETILVEPDRYTGMSILQKLMIQGLRQQSKAKL